MSQDHSNQSESKGLWYTYCGKGGASAVTFLWVLGALIWIFSILKWG